MKLATSHTQPGASNMQDRWPPVAWSHGSQGVSCGFDSADLNPVVVISNVFGLAQRRRAAAAVVQWSADNRPKASIFGPTLMPVDTPDALLRYLPYCKLYTRTAPLSINCGVVRPGGSGFQQALSVNRRFGFPEHQTADFC